MSQIAAVTFGAVHSTSRAATLAARFCHMPRAIASSLQEATSKVTDKVGEAAKKVEDTISGATHKAQAKADQAIGKGKVHSALQHVSWEAEL